MLNRINRLIKSYEKLESKLTTNIYIKNNQIIKNAHTNLRKEITMLVYSQNEYFKRIDLSTIEDNDPGIYFLINEKENSIYVGKTDNIFKNRLNCHIDDNKEFNKVILFYASSKYNRKWSPSITSFLESWFISFFNDRTMFRLLNNKNEQYKNWDEHDEDTLIIAFEALIWLCLSESINLNYPSNNVLVEDNLFNELNINDKVDVYLNNIKAEYYFNNSKGSALKLMNGTIINKKDFIKEHYAKSLSSYNAYYNWFSANVENNNLQEIQPNQYIVLNDFFTSCSISAAVILGKISCNGMDAWKTIDNKTINDLIKKD